MMSVYVMVFERGLARNIIQLHTITTSLPVIRDLLKSFKGKACEDVLEDQKP